MPNRKSFRDFQLISWAALLLLCLTQRVLAQEHHPTWLDWQGEPSDSQIRVGLMTGVLFTGTTNSGLPWVAVASKKIIPRGFVSNINNAVSAELMLGPVFLLKTRGVIYGAHLRWDFIKDSIWTFYALGGLGGHSLTSHFPILPRFGIGTFIEFAQQLSFRAELTPDLLGMGLSFEW